MTEPLGQIFEFRIDTVSLAPLSVMDIAEVIRNALEARGISVPSMGYGEVSFRHPEWAQQVATEGTPSKLTE